MIWPIWWWRFTTWNLQTEITASRLYIYDSTWEIPQSSSTRAIRQDSWAFLKTHEQSLKRHEQNSSWKLLMRISKSSWALMRTHEFLMKTHEFLMRKKFLATFFCKGKHRREEVPQALFYHCHWPIPTFTLSVVTLILLLGGSTSIHTTRIRTWEWSKVKRRPGNKAGGDRKRVTVVWRREK